MGQLYIRRPHNHIHTNKPYIHLSLPLAWYQSPKAQMSSSTPQCDQSDEPRRLLPSFPIGDSSFYSGEGTQKARTPDELRCGLPIYTGSPLPSSPLLEFGPSLTPNLQELGLHKVRTPLQIYGAPLQ